MSSTLFIYMLAVLKLLDAIKLLRQLIHLTAEFFLGDL